MKIFIALVVMLFPLLGLADWTKVASKDFEMADYPAEGSAEFKRDFAELLRLQKDRDPKDCALALRQKRPDFKLFFGDTDLLSAAEIRSLSGFMGKVGKLGDRIANYFKHQYERPRPFNTNDKVEPCGEKPTGSLSYPSSHAAIAKLDACVLAKIFPDRARRIKDYGKFLGDLRAVVGVHHPSDVEAGQQLGQDICDYLLEDESFQEELKEAKESV